MSMGTIKSGSNITDVSGSMMFEWRDVCEGWAIQQHTQLHFSYADEDDVEASITDLTWESKDGKRYTFNTKRTSNGQTTESFRGTATRNADGSVSVNYSIPKNKKLFLPAGTLFPSAHTQLILENAAKGEQFFSNTVFDGSDKDGYGDISSFISPKKSAEDETKNNEKASPLLKEAPVQLHLAFFDVKDEIGEPDYETDMKLLPNGVAKYMKTDYGDFSVISKLQEVEALPAPKCP